jgi:hypothetical protein
MASHQVAWLASRHVTLSRVQLTYKNANYLPSVELRIKSNDLFLLSIMHEVACLKLAFNVEMNPVIPSFRLPPSVYFTTKTT